MRFFYNLGRDHASKLYRAFSIIDIVAGIVILIGSIIGGIVTSIELKVSTGYAVLIVLSFFVLGMITLICLLISSGIYASLADAIENSSGGVYVSDTDTNEVVRLKKEVRCLTEELEKEKIKNNKIATTEDKTETTNLSVNDEISSPESKEDKGVVTKEIDKPKFEKATLDDIKVGTEINCKGLGKGVVISLSGSGDCTIRWDDKTESTIDLNSTIERGVLTVEK